MHVVVLELRGGRQHDVGEVGRVGQVLLADHGEEILPGQAGGRLGLIRGHDHGVGVVDEQALDRRVEAEVTGERRTEQPLVEDPGAGLDEFGSLQDVPPQREGPQGQLEDPAAHVTPGTGQARQGSDRPHGLAAVDLPFDGHADQVDIGYLRVAHRITRIAGHHRPAFQFAA